MGYDYDLMEVLDAIDPARLNYQEWLSVGMALADAGFTAGDWETWSRRDPGRFHPGECARKWAGFHGAANPVTAGTLVCLAKEQGWAPPRAEGHELGWDDVIGGGRDDLVVVREGWIDPIELFEPAVWNPALQLTTYLETLFESTENVGYVTECWEKDGRYLPTKGCWDRTAGELIQALNKAQGDLGAVLGDYNPQAGAWIRFNPLDGKGCKNENVTDFRYALVESDEQDLPQQYALIKELELPVAILVHSGKKSLHAIVRIDAANYDEYRKRVDYLYMVCEKNGLKLDRQNRNPSRLSRMPGVIRGEHKQYIVEKNFGKKDFAEWKEWIESANDDLPDPENMAEVWEDLPELSPPLIGGVLRQGHKLLLAGPSKAGKSYALIELCCAIAEGKPWFAWPCAKGRVMYVNLELDRASCLHRFQDVYKALGWEPENVKNIDIWNLRGKSLPMDKLAPRLIRRAAKRNYIAIIIDPIYKIITGDENSADQMARFCNQFDLVCTELGCAVIYCHHHSKGSQGQKKSMDRASGSGVFARDPDALLDLIELDVPRELRTQQEDAATCAACAKLLDEYVPGWEERVDQDSRVTPKAMLSACYRLLPMGLQEVFSASVSSAREEVRRRTAWRIEGTLREFPRFEPVNLWFDYPVHALDRAGVLSDVRTEDEAPPWKKAMDKRKAGAKAVRNDKNQELEQAIEACAFGDPPTKKQLAEYLGISERSVGDRIKMHGGFMVDKNNGGVVVRKAP